MVLQLTANLSMQLWQRVSINSIMTTYKLQKPASHMRLGVGLDNSN